jgi:hypothetical protein
MTVCQSFLIQTTPTRGSTPAGNWVCYAAGTVVKTKRIFITD